MKTESRYTKGQWFCEENNTHIFCGNGTVGVAWGDGDAAISNAKLMASAPELLEALMAVVESWDNGTIPCEAKKKAARAAIAKADGK